MKNLRSLPVHLALLLIMTVLLLNGCSTTSKKGQIELHPAGDGRTGYSSFNDQGVFEYKSMRLAVSHLRPVGDANQDLPKIINDLLEKDYIILRLDIENKSTKGRRLIYDPSQTRLTDNALDYRKPLDYTDLYDIVMSGEDEDARAWSSALEGVKGKFYDLAVTLEPHRSSSSLLIFRPLSDGIRKARLIIREIYVGTKTIQIEFRFAVKYAEPDEDVTQQPL